MSSPYTTLEFRFLSLDKMQAITLSREILGASYQPHLHESCFVGRVPLLEKNMDDINHFFIRQKVLESECDIHILIESHLTHTIINVQPIVNRMLKDIDCPLTFSFALK